MYLPASNSLPAKEQHSKAMEQFIAYVENNNKLNREGAKYNGLKANLLTIRARVQYFIDNPDSLVLPINK
jgi:uncharacterized protein YggL (DUF469 family)